MRPEAETRLTEEADQWIEAVALAPLPRADEGRSHREVVLTDRNTYWRYGSNRPGTHHARADTVAGPVPNAAPPELCSHCSLDPQRPGTSGLDEACYKYNQRNRRLPPLEVIEVRRQKRGLPSIRLGTDPIRLSPRRRTSAEEAAEADRRWRADLVALGVDDEQAFRESPSVNSYEYLLPEDGLLPDIRDRKRQSAAG